MKAQISILVLQELIRKTMCGKLISSAVITLENNTIYTKGSGIELAGKIDGKLSFKVSYPCIVEESGVLPIKSISDLLSKTEIFEKEDIVSATVVDNKLVMTREIPHRVVTYDLGDVKNIPTAYKGKTDVIFNNAIQQAPLTEEQVANGTKLPYKIPTVTIVNPSGKEKVVEFSGEAIVDSNQLKLFAAAAEIVAPLKIPMEIKDGTLNSAIKGTGTDMVSEIRVDKAEGASLSRYGVQLLEIFKAGFGISTIRFGNETPIHVRFKQDLQESDYFLVQTGNSVPAAAPVKVPKEKSK